MRTMAGGGAPGCPGSTTETPLGESNREVAVNNPGQTRVTCRRSVTAFARRSAVETGRQRVDEDGTAGSARRVRSYPDTPHQYRCIRYCAWCHRPFETRPYPGERYCRPSHRVRMAEFRRLSERRVHAATTPAPLTDPERIARREAARQAVLEGLER